MQGDSSTIKQRKDGSYKLVLKGVEKIHWKTKGDDGKDEDDDDGKDEDDDGDDGKDDDDDDDGKGDSQDCYDACIDKGATPEECEAAC